MLYKHYSNPDLGLFLVRLALAAVFIGHGWQKFGNMEGTIAFFGAIGLSAFWAYLVATVELLGGIAMLAGVFTFKAGVLLAIDMLFAIWLVKLGKGFIGGYEFELTLLLAALAVAFIGPGRYALGKRG